MLLRRRLSLAAAALALSIGIGAPVPSRAANDALFLTQTVPTVMVASKTYTVAVVVRNTGDTTWTDAANHRLGSQNPQDNLTWLTTNRLRLGAAESIGPGQDKTFQFTINAPASAGSYGFQWRMLQEFVEWFGGLTANVAVTVHLNVTADRSSYVVGEAPTYVVKGGAPSSALLWSSWKDGAAQEVDVDLGQTTDAAGNWSGTGPAWTAPDAGFWEKQVKVAGSTGAASFSVRPSLTSGAPAAAKASLGVTHVAGDYRTTTEPFLREGANLVRQVGSDSIFVYLTYNHAVDYPATDFGAPAALQALAQTAPYRELFEMPFSTYVITAFTFANQDWTAASGAFPAGRAAAETLEMRNLAAHLLQTYQGTGKTFILKNWEGDWWMNGSFFRDHAAAPGRVQAMADWFNARQQGIVQARADVGAVSGVQVLHALEFNFIDNPKRGHPSLLTKVVPQAQSDFIAYSAWHTIESPATADLRRVILDDIDFIRRSPGVGTRPLLITEYGFAEETFADSGTRTANAAQAFLDAGVPLSFVWEIIDNECDDGTCAGFGLVRQDGTKAPAWDVLRGLLVAAVDGAAGPGGAVLGFQPPEGTVTLSIPSGAFSENVTVTLQTPASLPAAPSPAASLVATGIGVEILLDKALQPARAADLTVSYAGASMPAGTDESKLILARHDPSRGVWIPLVSTPDPAGDRVTAKVDHFSVFQLMQAAPSGSVDAAKAFPNPLRPSRGHGAMTFSLLPANARIRIHTMTGRLVKDLSADAVGMASWDGTNQSGQRVASGVYFVYAQGAGEKRTFKVMVQR